jgi:nesprin-1
LKWCRTLVEGSGVEINNFGSSFGSGLAFVGIMAGLMPDKVELAACHENSRRDNYTLAFWIGLEAGQEPLLDVDDLMEGPHPDPLACQTYIFELMRKFSKGGSLEHNVTGQLL